MSLEAARLYSLLDVVAEGARVDRFGSRAVALAHAHRQAVPVAPAWVIPATVFRDLIDEALPPSHDMASLLRSIHKPSGVERAARVRERLLGGALSPLREAFSELASAMSPASGFVVATSVTTTDDPLTARAGLAGMRFGVGGADLESAVLALWSNAALEHTLCVLREARVRDVAVGAVILAPPEARLMARVLTEDPGWVWRHGTEEAGRMVTPKRRFLRVGPSEDTHDAILLDEKREVVRQRLHDSERPWLTGAERGALLDVVDRVAEALPVDVQLGIDSGGKPFVLSIARAVGPSFLAGASASTVWSRSGLDALLPAVPMPFTASLIGSVSDASLRNAIRELGGKMSKNAGLIHGVHGRQYFNLTELLKVVDSVPAVDAGAVLDLVRGAQRADVSAALDVRSRVPSVAMLSLAVVRLMSGQKRLADQFSRFEREANRQRKWLAEMDLAILPDDSLKTTLREVGGFFRDTARMLLSCSLASLSTHVALQALIARKEPRTAGRLAHALCAGVGDLETVAPALALAHVTEIARKEQGARDALLGGVSAPSELPQGPTRRALMQWLDAYGDHGVGEPEIARARWSEMPELLTQVLRHELGESEVDPDQRLSHVRVAADRELANLETSFNFVEAALLRNMVTRARDLLRLRERMRAWFARTAAMMRVVVRDVDRRMARLDRDWFEGAAFDCTYEELMHAVGSSRADLGRIARWRRQEHQLLSALPDPPEIFVGLPTPPAPDGPEIVGEATSAGVGRGPVRCVDLDDLSGTLPRPGEVVVVRSLDVGLAPFVLRAAGIVAECGGTLSHGAVLARELGIPAVVGVADARVRLKDGERVAVDGERGVVERLLPSGGRNSVES